VAVQYFFGKYGAVYKLLVAFRKRDDIKQLLGKHEKVLDEILMGLTFGFVIYIMVLLTFLVFLINSYTALSKIVTGIVIMLLLGYVLPNNKYDNAIGLIKRIWKNENELVSRMRKLWVVFAKDYDGVIIYLKVVKRKSTAKTVLERVSAILRRKVPDEAR
jgi:hypothetical protein